MSYKPDTWGLMLAWLSQHAPILYQRWREAQDDITKNGIIVMGAKQEIKNPACTVSNETLRQMAAYGGALGLDPAARARLKPGGEQKPDNPFTALRGGKAG